jgi:hypothetical protein
MVSLTNIISWRQALYLGKATSERTRPVEYFTNDWHYCFPCSDMNPIETNVESINKVITIDWAFSSFIILSKFSLLEENLKLMQNGIYIFKNLEKTSKISVIHK